MKFNNKKRAFTIAEIMIVLLILTILFAAFAPIITKRRVVSNRSRYAVWSWAGTSYTQGPMDAFYDPGDVNYTGTLFFGVTPDGKAAVKSTFLPAARVVIRSGPVTSSNALQRQIQFRYGRSSTTDLGTYAGTWLMDGKNVLLGGQYNLISDPNKIEARNNIGIGYNTLTNLKNAKNNTALGYYTLAKNNSGNDNVAIGYFSGQGLTGGKNNTYVGANAGGNNNGNYNTSVGYSAGVNGTGNINTFVGAYSGQNLGAAHRNVAVGAGTLQSVTTGSYNVAIGYKALNKVTTGGYNVGIGYNACSEVTTGSKKTCIGYNSGPKNGTSAEKYLNARADGEQRTYIGGTPYNYGGDAVLEIHNVGGFNSGLLENPGVRSNTTTVINGNLIVRGRPYFTSGSTLRHFEEEDPKGSSSEHIFGYKRGDDYVCASNQTTYSLSKCVKLLSSDRRLKNIGTRNLSGLKELNQLKVYNYTFKNDKDNLPHVGVIAQELQKVFPNSVVKGDDGYLRISWDEMFYASINGIKELDRKIIALVKRTTNVETQIAQLEKENISLKTQVENLSTRIEKLKTK